MRAHTLPAGQLVLGEVEGILQVNYGSSRNGRAERGGSGGLMLLVGAWLVSPARGRTALADSHNHRRLHSQAAEPTPACRGGGLGPLGSSLRRHVTGTES